MATTEQAFGPRFREAIDYLKGKLPEVSVAWDDLAGPVHAKVFTVAGSTSADLSRDIQQSLTSALEKGTTITQFRKDFDRTVQEHGWTYKGKRGWRTSVIFDNNMRSAHMAGRWQQLQQGKARRPYLQYRTAGDARVRPQHRLWNGLIFPIDDAFWQTHYPPNGWNCRCTVRAYSQADLEEKNLAVSEAVEMPTREVISREGEIKDQVPVGIDPGWDHNVGQAWISPELALGQKLARLPKPLQGIVVDRTLSPAFQEAMNRGFQGFRTGVKAGSLPAGSSQVIGFLDSTTIQAVAGKVPELESTAVAVFDDKLPTLVRSPAAPAIGWPEDWLKALPENFRNYRAVLWDLQERVLVIIPQGSFSDALPQIVVRLNASTPLGRAASVTSVGSAARAALANTDRYQVLMGRIGE